MRNRTQGLLGTVFAAALILCTEPSRAGENRPTGENPLMKLYVVGDSISVQYGPYLQTALTGVLDYSRKSGDDEALLDLDNPQGANGGDSSMVLDFLRALAAKGGFHTDLLMLNCGLHDIKTDPATGARQVPPERYESNLKAIVETVKVLDAKLIWVRTTPADEAVHNRPGAAFHRFAADVAAYNAIADRVMREAGVPIIDLFTFTRNLGPDLYADHVHFPPAIQRQQAAFLAGWLSAWISRGAGR